MDKKIKALATHLKIDSLEIKEVRGESFEAEGCEYLVLKDDEADELARDSILESLWAFNADFIASHSKASLDDHAIQALKELQASLCESANAIVKSLIEDLDHFVDDAIKSDGRAHFLNTYDGDEHEIQVGNEWFYIYRID